MYPKLMIAKKVRSDIEYLQYYYQKWSSDMCGLCAIAAIELAHRFRRYGYKGARAVWGYIEGVPWDHCWVELDGEIWDVTATQFGDDEIIRISKKNAKRYQEYKEDGSRHDGIHLTLWQRKVKPKPGTDISLKRKCLSMWPTEQKPQGKYTKYMRQS